MCRLPVKRLSKSKFFCGITTLHIWPCLGTSKCWGHSVLQRPVLVQDCDPDQTAPSGLLTQIRLLHQDCGRDQTASSGLLNSDQTTP